MRAIRLKKIYPHTVVFIFESRMAQYPLKLLCCSSAHGGDLPRSCAATDFAGTHTFFAGSLIDRAEQVGRIKERHEGARAHESTRHAESAESLCHQVDTAERVRDALRQCLLEAS